MKTEVKKHEDKKMASNSDIATRGHLRLRVRKCMRRKLDDLREGFNATIGLVKAGFTAAFIALIILHPWILLSYFVAINQIGNILFNYLLLTLWILDLAASLFGGIIMQGKRDGFF